MNPSKNYTKDLDSVNESTSNTSEIIMEQTHFFNACSSTMVREDKGQLPNKALQMMQRMGYKEGIGLGKHAQGITEPVKVSSQEGRVGFGFQTTLNSYELEDVNVEEKVSWLESNEAINISLEELKSQVKLDNPKNLPLFEELVCDPNLYNEIAKGKEIFNQFDIQDINKARGRSNPFETIHSVFFINRAALKLANIDAACDFMFTDINKYFMDEKGPIYFADICAGPGGFSEYLLWKNSWLFKGFGFTLKDEHDFNLESSTCIYPNSFDCYYGSEGDGNICNPSNIADFKEKVLFQTDHNGVHFVTADGGFCVDGNEDLQEVLSKDIYLCQCLVALEILRENGNFVTKLFDTFTRFSIGVIYLMYKCFKKIAIFKPNSSRPANSERYLICFNLQNNETTSIIKSYLEFIAEELWNLKSDVNLTIFEIVSMDWIQNDENFLLYLKNSISTIGNLQVQALKKLDLFCKQPFLKEKRQDILRSQCLNYWKIPNKFKRKVQPEFNVADYVNLHIHSCWLWITTKIININEFKTIYNNETNIVLYPLYSLVEKSYVKCSIGLFVGVGFKAYKWTNDKWVLVKRLQLPKGTILFGELVKEEIRFLNNTQVQYTLHVIDALYLGSICILPLDFDKRMELIGVFCESIRHVFRQKYVQIRQKEKYLVKDITSAIYIKQNDNSIRFYSSLPTTRYQSENETHQVKSLLLVEPHTLDYNKFCMHRQLDLQDENATKTLQILIESGKS